MITVVIPEFVVEHWWDQALHNQSAVVLRSKLRQRPNTAITLIPVQIAHHKPTPPPSTDEAAEPMTGGRT